MNEFAFARVLHVLGVVLWIGGVAMVTAVLFPIMAKMKSATERTEFFSHIENRFAPQARWTTLVVGLSGFYMVHVLDAWHRFTEARFWWMHAMVAIWLVFTLVLFVAEPLFLHRWFRERAAAKPLSTMSIVLAFHRILLTLSLLTIAGAVAGSHGWLLF